MTSMFEGMHLPGAFDAHVHLRDGAMMEMVVPMIRAGGVDMVYVMPNTVPPITTVAMALDYKSRLEALEPNVAFLMSLYLHSSTDPSVIVEAKKAGIRGVKVYPAGVTTNSSSGVSSDLRPFYSVFTEMQKQGLILNLHGELPSDGDLVNFHTAEEMFLPVLFELHRDFPRLRIILEHCTTKAAVEAVKSCGPTVAATITAHHLSLVAEDWWKEAHNFCKPVAKTPQDRAALLSAVVSGNPKFFLGSDSAPHPVQAKQGSSDSKASPAAGVFTCPFVVPLILDALEEGRGVPLDGTLITRGTLVGFLSEFGRRFYGETNSKEIISIGPGNESQIPENFVNEGETVTVVPFRRGQQTRSVKWV